MENLITKELLGDIFGFEIRKINPSILDGNLYYYKKFVKCKSKINIYELAHKCKEWATKQNYSIWSKTTKNKGIAKIRKRLLNNKNRNTIYNSWYKDNEVLAIIDVCEWIRKELLK